MTAAGDAAVLVVVELHSLLPSTSGTLEVLLAGGGRLLLHKTPLRRCRRCSDVEKIASCSCCGTRGPVGLGIEHARRVVVCGDCALTAARLGQCTHSWTPGSRARHAVN